MATQPKTVVKYRAKPKKKRRKAKRTIPILLVAPMVAPATRFVTQAMGSQGPSMALNNLVADFTGYNNYQGNFDAKRIKDTYKPILIGVIGHKIASWVGLNRALGRAGVPWIRL